MIKVKKMSAAAFAALAVLAHPGADANAAQCGSTAAGFETWKREFADEARTKGASATAVAPLAIPGRL